MRAGSSPHDICHVHIRRDFTSLLSKTQLHSEMKATVRGWMPSRYDEAASRQLVFLDGRVFMIVNRPMATSILTGGTTYALLRFPALLLAPTRCA